MQLDKAISSLAIFLDSSRLVKYLWKLVLAIAFIIGFTARHGLRAGLLATAYSLSAINPGHRSKGVLYKRDRYAIVLLEYRLKSSTEFRTTGIRSISDLDKVILQNASPESRLHIESIIARCFSLYELYILNTITQYFCSFTLGYTVRKVLGGRIRCTSILYPGCYRDKLLKSFEDNDINTCAKLLAHWTRENSADYVIAVRDYIDRIALCREDGNSYLFSTIIIQGPSPLFRITSPIRDHRTLIIQSNADPKKCVEDLEKGCCIGSFYNKHTFRKWFKEISVLCASKPDYYVFYPASEQSLAQEVAHLPNVMALCDLTLLMPFNKFTPNQVQKMLYTLVLHFSFDKLVLSGISLFLGKDPYVKSYIRRDRVTKVENVLNVLRFHDASFNFLFLRNLVHALPGRLVLHNSLKDILDADPFDYFLELDRGMEN